MLRRPLSLLVLSLVACSPCSREASSAPETLPWFEAEPLLRSLRPDARDDAHAALGPLEDLTLHDLDLTIDVEGAHYDLEQHIYFTNREAEALPEIVLRFFGNVLALHNAETEPAIQLVGAHCLGELRCTTHIDNVSALTVRPDTPLPPNGRLHILLRLSGTLTRIEDFQATMLGQAVESITRIGGGERVADYGLLSVGRGIASLANFYGVVARRDDGGTWVRQSHSALGDFSADEMMHFRARIRTLPGTTVVTSGVATSSEVASPTGGPSLEEHTVIAGVVRDFAVLASEDLQVESREVDNVVVRSYFLEEDRNAGARVLDAAAHSLTVFERRFGSYPYVDLDAVQAPLIGGAGGVEFSGLVTIANMLYRPSLGPLSSLLGATPSEQNQDMQQSMLEFTTAHEVAHQYWHTLVGSDSRQHPFVDESLSQFSALLYLEDRYGAERAEHAGNLQVRMNYRTMRALGVPDASVDRPVSTFEGSLDYAGFIYGKGPYVYPALRELLGDAAFFAGVRTYVEDYGYRIAPGRGLVEVFTTGPRGREVEEVAQHWLEETHGDEDLGAGGFDELIAEVLGRDDLMTATVDAVQRFLGGDDDNPEDTDELVRGLQEVLQGLLEPQTEGSP